jgi:hypothetical protein
VYTPGAISSIQEARNPLNLAATSRVTITTIRSLLRAQLCSLSYQSSPVSTVFL